MRMNDGKVGHQWGTQTGLGGPGSTHQKVPRVLSCEEVSQRPLRGLCHSQTAHRVSRSLGFYSLGIVCSVSTYM